MFFFFKRMSTPNQVQLRKWSSRKTFGFLMFSMILTLQRTDGEAFNCGFLPVFSLYSWTPSVIFFFFRMLSYRFMTHLKRFKRCWDRPYCKRPLKTPPPHRTPALRPLCRSLLRSSFDHVVPCCVTLDAWGRFHVFFEGFGIVWLLFSCFCSYYFFFIITHILTI